jgi:hypothetical protein
MIIIIIVIINRLPKHEYRERGRAPSFLGIFVLNFWYSVFAVSTYRNSVERVSIQMSTSSADCLVT